MSEILVSKVEMAIYKWQVKLNFCYLLLLIYCKAIRHNQECLEMVKMMKDDYMCQTPHCDIYELTTTESPLLESNLTESELDNGNWSAKYYRPIDQGYWLVYYIYSLFSLVVYWK